jgi:hypothetical protein
MSSRINLKTYGPPPLQAELPMTAVPLPLPPMTELFTKAQLVARHPHLLSINRVTWALRRRATNGLSTAVFDSPCGELLIHEPSFLAWFLGLGGRAKPRAGRRRGRRPGGLATSKRIPRGPADESAVRHLMR